MTALIRVLTPADAAAVAALHAAELDSWDAVAWADLLSDPLVVGLGMAGGDALTGVILMRAVADESEVLMIVVAPDQRRNGLGARLLAAGLDEVQERGAESAFLEVAVDNAGAIALYTRAGFVEIGRRREYYRRAGGAVDALLMRRGLKLDGAARAT